MDIVTGQRTFFIGVSATNVTANGTNIHVPFKDTSGNFLRCNYFKVDVVSNQTTTASGSIVVEPSGVSIFRTIGNNPICYATTALPGSGVCGVGTVFVNNGSVEWHGSNGEVCTAAQIRVNAHPASTILLGVLYGNLIGYNVLRSPTGGPGSIYDKGV